MNYSLYHNIQAVIFLCQCRMAEPGNRQKKSEQIHNSFVIATASKNKTIWTDENS
jgi:hypothetical protein